MEAFEGRSAPYTDNHATLSPAGRQVVVRLAEQRQLRKEELKEVETPHPFADPDEPQIVRGELQ